MKYIFDPPVVPEKEREPECKLSLQDQSGDIVLQGDVSGGGHHDGGWRIASIDPVLGTVCLNKLGARECGLDIVETD